MHAIVTFLAGFTCDQASFFFLRERDWGGGGGGGMRCWEGGYDRRLVLGVHVKFSLNTLQCSN